MISKRIIPLFLLDGTRLVKGTRFTGDFVDVGDPVSQGMIYDAQGAEEILIVDIRASQEGCVIDPNVINDMIYKCRLPIGAGGGVRTLEDARTCFKAGADKIIVNTSAVLNPIFVQELAREFGSQSVVASIDVRKNENGEYDVFVLSGTQKADTTFEALLADLIRYDVGEVMITSIDQEGTLSGMDHELYRKARKIVTVPLIASGGAGCYDDLVTLFQQTDVEACAIGKMLFLRDYDIVRIKAYLNGKHVLVRDA